MFGLLTADAVAPEALHAAFVAAFADYLAGPFAISLADWPGFLARQAVVLGLSRVAGPASEPAAFALVAPRADNACWRLAGMGARPAARGSGVAPALLDDLVARARAAGQRGVELECFAQNERALRLYRSRGFEAVHALHGYVFDGPVPAAAAKAPTEVGLAGAWLWLEAAARQLPGLPLQTLPATLACAGRPASAWQQGSAQLVFSLAAEGPAVVLSLVDRDPAQADAQALVHALKARCGERGIRVPALQRADVGGAALAREGFIRQALHQLLMQRPL